MTSGIYVITNTVSGKRYVGSSGWLTKRWGRHRKQLREGSHHSRHLQRAWNAYGEESFVFSVLEHCEKDELVGREQHYLDALKPEYNECVVANNCLGVKHGPETLAKLSAVHKGKPTAAQQSGALSFKGRKHTEESKAKMSASLTGKPMPEDVRKKISATTKGRPVSPEQRERLTKLNRAKAKDPAYLAKLSEAAKRRWQRPEYRENQAAGLKTWWAEREL